MLIGEIVLHDSHSTRAHPFMSLYRHRLEATQSNGVGCAAAASDGDGDGGDAKQQQLQPVEIIYLEPRILRTVNTTNLRLQHEALLQRRAHVIRLHDSPTQPGRGPPQQQQQSDG